MYFDELIYGFDFGLLVKLCGVCVGCVVDLNVCYDGKMNFLVVVVVCEFSCNMMFDEKGV